MKQRGFITGDCYVEMEDSILCSITGHEQVRSDSVRGEKRKSLRIPMSMRVNVTIIRPTQQLTTAVVREISTLGIGMLGEFAMEAGSEFIIEFRRQGFAPWWVMYRTVRCARAAAQQRLHIIGALFAGMQSHAPQIAAADMIGVRAATAEASEMQRIRQAVLG